MSTTEPIRDVYSAREIARAAGVRPADVKALAAADIIRPLTSAGYFSRPDAVRAVRSLSSASGERALFRPVAGVRRNPGLPLVVSGTLHGAMAAIIALLASVGVAHTQARQDDRQNLHLVFLMSPGPGGGGGGGGLKQPAAPPAAERKGPEPLKSPVAVKHEIAPVTRTRPTPPPPPRIDPPPVVRAADPPPVAKADAIQPVFAPVVPTAADPRDRAGLPWKGAPESADSRGPGAGGGTGSGDGSGAGSGQGAGVGPGSGGGTGGGPYRPGSGISAPSILREVTPDYTDEGRRRAIEGDVVLEIVVRADGSVGTIRTLQGLGAGLDQRAIDAVRQWRFNPARRYGTPVDVIVEVAVEFKLR